MLLVEQSDLETVGRLRGKRNEIQEAVREVD